MNFSFPDDTRWFAFLSGVIFSTAGFTCYHFLNQYVRQKHMLKWQGDTNVRQIIFQRLSGVFIYAILPLLFYYLLAGSISLPGIQKIPGTKTFIYLGLLALVIVPLNYFNAPRPSNIKMYPEIRNRQWTPSLVFLSALSWIVYLFAYEFIFRGFLFFPALELFGLWPAVIINAGIYSLVHVPKGPAEGVGALILGPVLCLLAAFTGSFWIAFFTHIILALSNEWLTIARNPEIKIVKE